MPHRQDTALVVMKAATAITPLDLNSLEPPYVDFLAAGDPTSGNAQDAWMEFWTEAGIGPGNYADRAYEWLRGKAFTGSIEDMWKQYWDDLGSAAAQFAIYRGTERAELVIDPYQLRETTDGSSYYDVDLEFGLGDGKFYCEFVAQGLATASPWFGLTGGSNPTGFLGSGTDQIGYTPGLGAVRVGNNDQGGAISLPRNNTSVLSLLVDFNTGNGTVIWYVDGVQGATGVLTLPLIASGGTLSVGAGQGSGSSSYEYRVNSGQEPFAHPELIPSGTKLGWGLNLPVQP